MAGRWVARHLASLVTTTLLLAAGEATAQMTLLESVRYTYAYAQYQGVVDSTRDVASSPTAYFDSYSDALAEKYEPCQDPPPDECLVGSCSSGAFQNSEFFPAGIQFTGGSGASWGIPPSGAWGFASVAYFRFTIATVFDYQLFADVDPGDWAGLGLVGGDVELESGSGFTYHYVNTGTVFLNGRLGPGEYVLTGRSTGTGSLADMQGAVYGAQWLVTQVANPLIITQPLDLLQGCGGSAVFSITTSGPPGSYTYQWRKNLTPLTNSSHISGATAPTLTIDSACDADTGYYDVVVTGTISGQPVAEPSRLAHFGTSGTTGVAEGFPGAIRTLTLRAPTPNPFRGGTSIGYALPSPTRLRAAVYNLAGAKVRTLVDEVVPGSGAVTWDGNLRPGTRAPRGIYFVRVEAEGVHETKKVVLVD